MALMRTAPRCAGQFSFWPSRRCDRTLLQTACRGVASSFHGRREPSSGQVDSTLFLTVGDPNPIRTLQSEKL